MRLAEKAAKNRGRGCIGSEDLLLGLLREGKGTAAIVLRNNKVQEKNLEELIERLVTPETGAEDFRQQVCTPRAQYLLDNARKEAASFRAEEIGTEHILIAMAEGSGMCCDETPLYNESQHLKDDGRDH